VAAQNQDPESILSGLIEDLVAEPRRESERLLAQYGSLADIYEACVADSRALANTCPKVSNRLRNIAGLVDAALKREVAIGPVVSDFNLLVRRLSLDMAALPRETFRVLFLNAENRLLRDQIMWEGSVSSVQVHPREVVRCAIETSATALIFAHNHPSGDPTPSRGDIDITSKLVHACASVDVLVHDHVVVAQRGFVSMRSAGLLFPTADQIIASQGRRGG
jgi:DNA repair protein RadC